MKRPSDQVKLLVFGLLRTASALASSSSEKVVFSTSTTAAAAAASSHWQQQQSTSYSYQQQQQHQQTTQQRCTAAPSLTLRLAQVQDVPAMAACNLATLPENYNHNFYIHHIQSWPDLALVVVQDKQQQQQQQHRTKAPHQTYEPPTQQHALGESNEVVAYVLGKVEERTVYRVEPSMASRLGGVPPRRTRTVECNGHVTSLAVLEPFRRQGLAADLLNQLHYHMETNGSSTTQCGLHVRMSNRAATRLYEKFGYSVTETIPAYYQDGEDAYYMTRPIEAVAATSTNDPEQDVINKAQEMEAFRSGFLGNLAVFRKQYRAARLGVGGSSSSFFWRSNSSSSGATTSNAPEHLRLPRTVGNAAAEQYQEQREQEEEQQQQQEAAEELMTGTM